MRSRSVEEMNMTAKWLKELKKLLKWRENMKSSRKLKTWITLNEINKINITCFIS